MEEDGEDQSRGEEAKTSSTVGSSPAGGGSGDCRQNGLINTHRLGAEPRENLVSVYSAPQYQGHVVVSAPPQQEHSVAPPQLLNPSALLHHQVVVDPNLRPTPAFLPCLDGILQAWEEAGGGDCCETTFIEVLVPDASSSSAATTKEETLFTEGRFFDFPGDNTKIHTSYDIDDDEFQELEKAAKVLVQVLVISHLDYCPSLLAGLPASVIRLLQLIQNAAAQMVFNLTTNINTSTCVLCCERIGSSLYPGNGQTLHPSPSTPLYICQSAAPSLRANQLTKS
ncbi:uncharacterized protein [Paralichthys olivaceus]|uniref:uncharacterized protein isoform X1 n=1 Tax=Paralichthys olivaceus TaxID=8255 RepID=UPI003752C07E